MKTTKDENKKNTKKKIRQKMNGKDKIYAMASLKGTKMH